MNSLSIIEANSFFVFFIKEKNEWEKQMVDLNCNNGSPWKFDSKQKETRTY